MIKLEMAMSYWTILCDTYTCYCSNPRCKDDYNFIQSICERMKVIIKRVDEVFDTFINVELLEEEFITLYDNLWWSIHEGGCFFTAENDNEILKDTFFLLDDIKSKNSLSSKFDGDLFVKDYLVGRYNKEIKNRIFTNAILKEVYKKETGKDYKNNKEDK